MLAPHVPGPPNLRTLTVGPKGTDNGFEVWPTDAGQATDELCKRLSSAEWRMSPDSAEESAIEYAAMIGQRVAEQLNGGHYPPSFWRLPGNGSAIQPSSAARSRSFEGIGSQQPIAAARATSAATSASKQSSDSRHRD